ncbi:T9SS type B sorting domain-containing protein [Aquimarina sp. RZ0]|uniref:T9SS type B sorting domain-containing protein n=1 Tax=Aquimarina sp. RZ0 TaxID=2607730 RepID=UPI0011F10B15|nr:T9SS type B sorting domain-containing protein [Aquimarina sp. RZ0]KAA1246719.1 T9SS type B sorting domain-containing protein [Aquimarina sp. RZ0]
MIKLTPQISLFFVLLFFRNAIFYSQDFDIACRTAEPFCSDAALDLTFANTIGDVDGLGEVGCLNTTPNPSWFFMRIDTAGELVFDIRQWVDEDGDNRLDRQERQLDVDFIAWGPFNTSFVVCDILERGCDLNGDGENIRPAECVNNVDDPDFYINNDDNTNIIDCSYARTSDENFIETFTIPNAQSGEYYLVLITNFADESGVIQLDQTNLDEDDAGTTDCSVLVDGVGPDIATCGEFPVAIQGRFGGAVRYQWYQDDGTGNFVPIAGATDPFLEVNQPGTYQLEGFDISDVSLGTDSLQVLDVSTVEITVGYRIDEESFNGVYTITAEITTIPDIQADGFTDFEYRLDRDLEDDALDFFTFRDFQSSPIFENVPPGDYQIVARYANCPTNEGESIVIMILGYPKYFTPNGDNFHDTWNVINPEDQPTPSLIYIFDRNGKLLKQLNPAGSGWDGTYNGSLMPSSQYWFRVEFNEQLDRDATRARRVFSGSFSLIR